MMKTQWQPDGSLENRLYKFAENSPRAEIIDRLTLTPAQAAAEKADLFFESRAFIAEVKALSTDTGAKINAILAPYQDTEDWPVFFGKRDIGDILPHLPNPEALRRNLYEAVSSAIPELVRKANRQIRTTRQTFDLPEARGILIVLNDLVGILTPDIIAHRIAATLAKRKPDGLLQFPEIAGVWIISEQHKVQLTPALQGLPAVFMLHPSFEEDALTDEFLRRIQGLWASFNGLPLVRMQPESFKDLKYRPAKADEKAETQPVRMQDLWVEEYRARPYLRSLTDDELRAYGAKLGIESGNMFLKGSRARHHERIRGVRRFGDFIEEFNHRKLDLRSLAPFTEAARIFLPAHIRNEDLRKTPSSDSYGLPINGATSEGSGTEG